MVSQYKQDIPGLSAEHLEAIVRVLAGLTGAEIGHILAQCQVPDLDSSNKKWKQPYNAFAEFQNEH